ncbi:MAG: efflux RND transporter permease subunit [Hyphomicrobiales bacterium]|nr:efflux RND transporter permease subunit [Hyphomicrobiales bacterium]
MNFSAPFIRRPVATTLLAVGIFLAGVVAYFLLPVSSLPSIELPTVRIIASRPGADPATMAASVAAPLERHLSEIAGITELTSTNTLGSSVITAQFDLNRKIDKAAQDVQSAINAAVTDLPSDLPTVPAFRKANSNAFPVLILALTSDTMPASAIYDAADTVIAQKMSQVDGVAEVQVSGAEQPAIRVQVDPSRLASMRLGLDTIANRVIAADAHSPVGSYDGPLTSGTFDTNDQLTTPEQYQGIVIPTANGAVRLGDIARIDLSVRNTRAAGWFNRKPAVLLLITKQPDANVIQTVDGVKALLPELKRWIPAGIDIHVLTDRTTTIRASIDEIQRTLLISIGLVMLVVFLFVRRAAPTIAAGVTVPLSLAGTFACMKAVGFSLDNISLMAVIAAVGFVVDDAIVMIENVYRNMEAGKRPLAAALDGARQIGFTVISISLSLVAAFIPLLFLSGIGGKFFREFSLTMVFAIAISTFVSLSVTPMICARFLKVGALERHNRLDRIVEGALGAATNFYSRTLGGAIRHPWFSLLTLIALVVLNVYMFKAIPKGYFPQDDTGLIFSFTEASPDVSFPAMAKFQQQAADVVMADPDVENVASFIGGTNSVNQGRIFIALKPEGVRSGSSRDVINRLRAKLARVAGITVYMFPVQDIRAGGRQSKSQYQFTLWDPSLDEVSEWTPKVLARLRQLSLLADVTTDREQGGLRANVVIDRDAASRLGVAIQDIDTALNTAFGQRQTAIIYTQRNQYRVVVESVRARQRDPTDLSGLYVSPSKTVPLQPSTSNFAAPPRYQVPLTAVARIERGAMPLVVNHQGPFPAVTISFNLAEGATLDAATTAIQQAVADMNPPDGLRTEFAGEARDFRQTSSNFVVLIFVALLAVYLILGILYESLIHPVTIISTLPSAGLGALLALKLFGAELTLIAAIGIILLIGIVKKNGIMLVDFAISAERSRDLTPAQSAHEAAVERFRPILMTTLAALFGALPLAIATGAGAELRRPLGITIVGGLVLSQILTLYTTPVVYLLMDRLSRRRRGEPAPASVPAE